jgi:hypothetical protein
MPSTTRFVVFHAGIEHLTPYMPLMRIGRKALEHTNPGAQYIVLTDSETAPYLDKEFETEVLAPRGWPLMRQYVEAQRAYLSRVRRLGGLTVLAGTDCAANRSFNDACTHDLGITYRPRGRHRVNNIAYVHDHDLGAWFLKRALGVMRPEDYDYYGDQASWEAVLGPPEGWELVNPLDKPEGMRRTLVDGRIIYLYPCRTHNYFRKMESAIDKLPPEAYLIHYKGPRKNIMVASVQRHILHKRVPLRLERSRWREYPMQKIIGDLDGGN